MALYPAGATFGPRRLRDFEFVWLIEGDAEYRHDDTTVAAPQGSIVLCRPPAVDSFRWDPTRRTRHAYFHFELVGELPTDWPPAAQWPLVRLPPGHDDLLATLFRHLLAWNGRGDTTQTRLLALSLLAAYVSGQTASAEVAGDPLPPAVEAVMAHIARRLDEDAAVKLPLAELAGVACVTPEHLCRTFKAATGHSPAETVRLARLDRAVTLLTRTNFSVAEVAALSGFESQFHFSRLVRAAYGRSPRALRQAFTEGEAPPTTRLLRQETRPVRRTPGSEAGTH